MITITEQKIYENLPFEEYLKLPGYSHSDIRNKGQKVFATSKMQLGTAVHNYLLTPAEYSGENSALVVPLAAKLKAEIGPLLPFLKPELSITCKMNVVNPQTGKIWGMAARGRADLGIPGRFGIDIKVSEMPLKKAVEYFEYDNQQNGYAIMFKFQQVIIIAINPKTRLVSMYVVPMQKHWWAERVLEYGRPA